MLCAFDENKSWVCSLIFLLLPGIIFVYFVEALRVGRCSVFISFDLGLAQTIYPCDILDVWFLLLSLFSQFGESRTIMRYFSLYLCKDCQPFRSVIIRPRKIFFISKFLDGVDCSSSLPKFLNSDDCNSSLPKFIDGDDCSSSLPKFIDGDDCSSSLL